MKSRFPVLLSAAILAGVSLIGHAVAAEAGWIDDLDKALAKAKQDNKPVLAEFTGSDWCPPCKMMHQEVFSKPEFVKKASEKFILAVVDIPNGNPELRKKNQAVLEKYKVQGVPTVILFDTAGKEFDRFTASKYPTVEKFLAHLGDALDKKDMQ